MKQWDEIIAYLEQTDSPETRKELENWLSQAEANQEYFQKVKRVWETLPKNTATNFNPNVEKAWEKLEKAKKDAYPFTVQRNSESDNKVNIWSRLPQIAAILVLGLSFVFALYRMDVFSSDIQEISTYNTKKEVILADGTKVWLNKNSTLKYPKSFEGKDLREVELEGEAFFDVVKNKNQPFRIRSGATTTQVLGTSFNLRNYEEDSVADLVLVTGKVNFSYENQELILTPNEVAVFSKSQQTLVKSLNTDINALAWKEEKLIFRDVTMEQLLATLERYFRVEIELEDQSLKNCPYNSITPFEKPNLETFFQIFQANGWEVNQQNGTYIISGSGC